MSLGTAFSNGLGGLATIATWADATSSNIANVDRPGYARRTVATVTGVNGIARAVETTARDDTVERLHRMEVGRAARQDAVADLVALHTARLGQPGDDHGLAQRIARLDGAFAQMSSTPEVAATQSAAVDAAIDLAAGVRGIASSLDELAATARTRVDHSVSTANADLLRIAEINVPLGDPATDPTVRASYEDEMAAVLDRLADMMDLRTIREPDGTVTAHGAGGTVLVSGGRSSRLAFDAATGRLTVAPDGPDITPGRPGARGFEEGRLAGEIAVLRTEVPRMREQIDAFAATLVETFEAADATRAAGQPGLFTDAGAALGAARDGVAGRLEVNARVRPDGAGEAWRLRDGFGATTPGAPGDTSQVRAYAEALDARATFGPARDLPTEATLGGYAAQLVTAQHAIRVRAEERDAAISAGAAALGVVRTAATGVDLDAELQDLTRIQQGYRANSEVMRVLAEMLDTLIASM